MRKYLLIGTLIVISARSYGLDYNGYRLDLDKDTYVKLNTFERAQYKKAMDLAEDSQYRAAASEFEKFKEQFADSPILPDILFLKGYSLHMQKDRISAIKVYNEVLDYFGEEIDPASKALYFLGLANFDNGNTKQGMEAMVEMVEDKDYSQHPLAAWALNALADNHWKNGEQNEAVKYWKQIVEDFSKSNGRAVSEARDSIINYYVINRDYAGLDSWATAEGYQESSKGQRWFAGEVNRNVYEGFIYNRGGYKVNQFQQQPSIDIKKAYVNYYLSKRNFFEQDQDMWSYYYNAINFLSRVYNDDKELFEKTIQEMIVFVSKKEDKKAADGSYNAIIDRLKDDGRYTQAEMLIARMDDKVWAEWKSEELLERQSKWNDAIKKLDTIAAMNAKDAQRCVDRKAYIYMNALQQYDLAIKAYREVDNPPNNLWQIAECQYRQRNLQEAIGTLSEIENSFPDSSPNAAWKKVEYYQGANDTKQGIAAARRIMKMYPESSASSQAHQYLEDYGIATGGGVL